MVKSRDDADQLERRRETREERRQKGSQTEEERSKTTMPSNQSGVTETSCLRAVQTVQTDTETLKKWS